MVRGIALTGMAGGFLALSPKLRYTVWDGFASVVGQLEQYSPFSYVGLAVLLLFGFLACLRASSAPR